MFNSKERKEASPKAADAEIELEDKPDAASQASGPSTPEASELEKLRAENADLQDQLLRRRADFDNYRRRVATEHAERTEYASMEAVRQLLPVLDNFYLAQKAPTADEGYAKGVDLIYQQFFEVLRNLGLETLQAKGAKFDPNLHHAIEQVPTPDVPAETVLDVLQEGYLFKGKLLRPALVRVSVKP